MAGFPQELTTALEALVAGRDHAQLGRDAQNISENYRLRTGTGGRLLTKESEAAAYAAARMPATYAAAQAALEEAIAAGGMELQTLLDCGAGTGAATWAAAELLELEKITCLEPSTGSGAWRFMAKHAVDHLFTADYFLKLHGHSFIYILIIANCFYVCSYNKGGIIYAKR